MTQLLVSVRDGEEALTAIRGGVDVLDVKEPNNGSLGRATSAAVNDAIQVASAHGVPGSVALGELCEFPIAQTLELAANVQFVKLGLAGMANEDWRSGLSALQRQLQHEPTRLVAVAYADAYESESPAATAVVEAAESIGCAGVLVDTFDKTQGGLLDHLALDDLERLVKDVQSRGMFIALAGSLTLDQLASVTATGPDLVAVRSAVCEHGRSGRVVESLVRRCHNEIVAELPQSANSTRNVSFQAGASSDFDD